MSASVSAASAESEIIRAAQRERSAALLKGDIQSTRSIHADDIQLITPLVVVLSKEQYLSAPLRRVFRYIAVKSVNASMSFHVAVRDTTAHENAWGAYAVGGSAVRGW